VDRIAFWVMQDGVCRRRGGGGKQDWERGRRIRCMGFTAEDEKLWILKRVG